MIILIIFIFLNLSESFATIPISSTGWKRGRFDLNESSLIGKTWKTVNVLDNQFFNISVGSTTTSQDISDILSAFGDEPIILFFPDGDYYLEKSVQTRSNVIIKGESNTKTIFHITTSSGGFAFYGWTNTKIPILEEIEEGDNEVRIDSSYLSEFNIGDIVHAVEDLEDGLYDDEWAKHTKGVVAKIVNIREDNSKNQGIIELNVNFEIGMNVLNMNAEIYRITTKKNIGLENFRIQDDYEEKGGHNIVFQRCYNTYVKDIFSNFTSKHHVYVSYSHQVEIIGNYFNDAFYKGGGGYGYGVITQLDTTFTFTGNNILRNLRHQLVSQAGANNNVFAYNLNVDDVRDYCHQNPEETKTLCRDSSWIESKNFIGTEGTKQGDMIVHGNYPHFELFEGNVVYSVVVDVSHFYNGPRNTFFRNFVKGVPKYFGYWLETFGMVIMGANDNQTMVYNYLINNSTVELYQHSQARTSLNSIVGGNFINGKIDWNDLNEGTTFPSSLYTSDKPDFWCDEVDWPPFGIDVTNSQNNIIPAQRRYEGLSCTQTNSEENDKPTSNNTNFITPLIIVGCVLLVVFCIVLFVAILAIIVVSILCKTKAENNSNDFEMSSST